MNREDSVSLSWPWKPLISDLKKHRQSHTKELPLSNGPCICGDFLFLSFPPSDTCLESPHSSNWPSLQTSPPATLHMYVPCESQLITSALNMRTSCLSETLVYNNQPMRGLNPKEHDQNCHHREKLISHTAQHHTRINAVEILIQRCDILLARKHFSKFRKIGIIISQTYCLYNKMFHNLTFCKLHSEHTCL
jgi:hypothetical protein